MVSPLLLILAIEDVFEDELKRIGWVAGDAVEGVLYHAGLAGEDEFIGWPGDGFGAGGKGEDE